MTLHEGEPFLEGRSVLDLLEVVERTLHLHLHRLLVLAHVDGVLEKLLHFFHVNPAT